MPSLNSQAFSRRKRIAMVLHVLVAVAIIVAFGSNRDMPVRAIGVAGSAAYLFAMAFLSYRRATRTVKVTS